jgi:hypothetical protein
MLYQRWKKLSALQHSRKNNQKNHIIWIEEDRILQLW